MNYCCEGLEAGLDPRIATKKDVEPVVGKVPKNSLHTYSNFPESCLDLMAALPASVSVMERE